MKNQDTKAAAEQMTLQVRIRLPDYEHWRIVIFIRQYSYLAVSVAILGLLGLILLISGLSWLLGRLF